MNAPSTSPTLTRCETDVNELRPDALPCLVCGEPVRLDEDVDRKLHAHPACCSGYVINAITPLATPVMEVELHCWVDRITVILAVRVFACVGTGEAQAVIYGRWDFEAKEHRPAVIPVRNPHSTRATIEHVLAAARCSFVVRNIATPAPRGA